MTTEHDQKLKLIELVRQAIEHDDALRKKHDVGERFRFVRDRLHSLLEQLELHLKSSQKQEKEGPAGLSEEEVVVYVYLYNAQGIVVSSWHNMLTPKLFYEYSVNRPAYTDISHIEQLIRSKTTKVQHAYLTVAVNKRDIIESDKKDVIGSPVVKIREGGLKFDRFLTFTHNGIDYTLDEESKLIKK